MKKIKLVLNATPLVKGGALQACVGFIREVLSAKESKYDWHFVLSKEVADEINNFGLLEGLSCKIFSASPAKSRVERKLIKQYVEGLDPDAVFSFFGPTYIRFDCLHLMGFADGWLTHANMLAIEKKGGFVARTRLYLVFLYKRYWTRFSNRWVVEANVSKQGLISKFNLHSNYIDVVPNNCGEHYLQHDFVTGDAKHENNILVFSSYYAHKNIEIVPVVAAKLREINPERKFKFILTLAKSSADEARILEQVKHCAVEDCIENIGPVAVSHGPSLYQKMKIAFMPSLLETSSAVYPEAMVSGVPIVTTDIPFAHDSCGQAALFYSPLDADAAAKQIDRLLNDSTLYNKQVENGFKVQSRLPTPRQKHDMYCQILEKMVQRGEVS